MVRSMNRKGRDRGAEMRLTERTIQVDSRDKARRTERSDQLYVGMEDDIGGRARDNQR